ncbi:MAG: pentapeptide repeat-containing protein, partial [Dehalococcoidia bacterium]
MTTSTTTLSAQEFMRKAMDGERQFQGIRLPEGQNDFTQDAAALQAFNKYMRAQDLRTDPVIADGADWRGAHAQGLVLPYSKLPKADLRGADLREADVRRTDFTEAQLQGSDVSMATLVGARLQGADLSDAVMRATDLYEAGTAGVILCRADMTGALLFRISLKDADLTDANVFMAQSYRADLRGVKGLETVKGLGTVRFHKLMVTARERELVEAALRSGPMFEVLD